MDRVCHTARAGVEDAGNWTRSLGRADMCAPSVRPQQRRHFDGAFHTKRDRSGLHIRLGPYLTKRAFPVKMNAQHHSATETATIREDFEVNDRILSTYFRRVEFHDRTVTAVCFRGRWTFRAAEVGLAIGYADGARMVDKIRGEWSDEFAEGKDYDLLRGAALKEFKRLSPESGDSAPDRTPSLLVLYESGIDRALILARTPRGRELRDLLVEHVLPQLRATGTATLPGAPGIPSNDTVLIDMQRQLLKLRELLAAHGERVVRVEAELASGLLGPLKGREIDRRLTSLAKRATMYGDRKWRSYRRTQANFLAFALGHVGQSSSWRYLPAAKEEQAFRTLAAMERDADRAMERGAREAQDHLPAVGILGKPAAAEPRPVALLHPRTGRPLKGVKSLKN